MYPSEQLYMLIETYEKELSKEQKKKLVALAAALAKSDKVALHVAAYRDLDASLAKIRHHSHIHGLQTGASVRTHGLEAGDRIEKDKRKLREKLTKVHELACDVLES